MRKTDKRLILVTIPPCKNSSKAIDYHEKVFLYMLTTGENFVTINFSSLHCLTGEEADKYERATEVEIAKRLTPEDEIWVFDDIGESFSKLEKLAALNINTKLVYLENEDGVFVEKFKTSYCRPGVLPCSRNRCDCGPVGEPNADAGSGRI